MPFQLRAHVILLALAAALGTSSAFAQAGKLGAYAGTVKVSYGTTTELENIKKDEDDTQNRMAGLEKTIDMIREEMNVTSRKLDARQNEFNLTKSLVENLEGFPEAIKFLKFGAS